jgi:YesN/AraC family two-component response regulator
MRPGIFEEKSNNHLKEVTVKIRERYRASTYAQLEETASGDSNRVKEKRFLSFIALGNAVLADEFLARAYNKQESFRFGVMSTSSIQQARYATVASVTLFCRTAIDNGLPENLAYSISDSYLLHLDETESIEEIQFLSLSAFREYCQVMQDWRLQSCRKEIKQCCEYILMHIHEPISLTELAELVNLSPNHLSALFLKETSFRPTEYIRDYISSVISRWNQHGSKQIVEKIFFRVYIYISSSFELPGRCSFFSSLILRRGQAVLLLELPGEGARAGERQQIGQRGDGRRIVVQNIAGA